MTARRGAVALAAGLLAVAAIAGCDTVVGGVARPGASPPPLSVASSAAPSSSPAPPSTPPSTPVPPTTWSAVDETTTTTTAPPTSTHRRTPAPPAPPPRPAADYGGCADGNCEVAVTGPVDIPLGGHGGATTLAVASVTEDSISYTTSGPGGSGSGDISGGGVVSFAGGDSDTVTARIAGSVPGGVVLLLTTS